MNVEVEYNAGLDMAVGVNLATGNPKRSGVFSNSDAKPSGGFVVNEVTATLATSKSDLLRSLNVSATANASYGAFSASASVDVVKELTVSKYGVWLTIVGKALYTGVFNDSPSLTDDALEFLNTNGTAAFAGAYGHFYVRGLQHGAAICLVAQWITESQSEQEELTAKLTASGVVGSFSADASGSITQKLKQTQTSTNATIHYIVKGGVQLRTGLTVEEAIDSIKDFFATVTLDNAVPVIASLGDYDTLMPEQYKKPPLPLQIGVTLASNCQAIQADIDSAEALIGTLQEAAAHPERYEASDAELTALTTGPQQKAQAFVERRTQSLNSYKSQIEASSNALAIQVPDDGAVPGCQLPTAVADPAYYIQTLTYCIGTDPGNPTGPALLQPINVRNKLQRWILRRQDTLTVGFQNGATKLYLATPLSQSDTTQLVQVAQGSGYDDKLKWMLLSPVGIPGGIGAGSAPAMVISYAVDLVAIALAGTPLFVNQTWTLSQVDAYAEALPRA
ncbi:hypothetical protein G4177_10175 [Corallococcus sp. ZKHCc1 1396]|uniref:MACPF domain-containing protein n=1 Tax=Corallococcus soli TaxID=2710757 RepID=A0ABR9PKV5_9BACT|nr:hypothetical protein [Corallococcus soli]MBE4748530.1 hypothetical protein [Corallococcus soli]